MMIVCTFCEELTPATWIGYYMHTTSYGMGRAYKAACDEHKAELEGLDDIAPVEQVIGMGVMTLERACELHGYDGPQEWMEDRERKTLLHCAIRYSDNDLIPIPPGLVDHTRWVLDEF